MTSNLPSPHPPVLRPEMLAAARMRAAEVLGNAWRPERGCCFPNANQYPHLWLWDSSFHAIGWAGVGDERGVVELTSVLDGQLDDGFVPHMVYAEPTTARGPLTDRSGFTQPPIYAHAARCLRSAGFTISDELVARIGAGLEWLLGNRRVDHLDGLLTILHPWETGQDDSPRYDAWVGTTDYDFWEFWRFDQEMVQAALFNHLGAAVASTSFATVSSGFNALVAHACDEMFALCGDPVWQQRSEQLATALDAHLWDDDLGLWVDAPVVGPTLPTTEATSRARVLDGVLPALVSANPDRCARAIATTVDPSVFGGPFGPAFVARTEPTFLPDIYWRGPAWPQVTYLLWQAARRGTFPGARAVASQLAHNLCAGALKSGFAEYWNPDNGTSIGATPQTWASVVSYVAFTLDP